MLRMVLLGLLIPLGVGVLAAMELRTPPRRAVAVVQPPAEAVVGIADSHDALAKGDRLEIAAASSETPAPPALEHDPEKWVPVFRKDHAQIKEIERDDDSKKSHRALGIWGDAAGGRESQFLSVETQERPSERIARDGARHAERK